MTFANVARLLLPVLFLPFAVAVVVAADGHTVWNTMYRATVIEDNFAHAEYHRVAPDGAGGVVVAWQHDMAGGIRVQRLDHAGSQMWPSAGRVLSTTGQFPSLSAHPGGGFVVAWHESTGIYVQHVSAAGMLQWTPGGVRIGTTGQQPVVRATSTAGTFVMWRSSAGDARIGNVNDSGTPTAPGVDGVSLGANAWLAGDMALVASGLGSIIAVWPDDQSPQRILAQKIGPGFPWGTTPTVVGAPAQLLNAFLDAEADGSGGAIVAWRSSVPDVQIRAQRIDTSGTTSWTTGGEVLVDSSVVGGDINPWSLNFAPAVAPDDAGGAFVAWTDWRHSTPQGSDDDVYMQHLSWVGSQTWTANGRQLGWDPSGSERNPDLIPDAVGGVIVGYQENVDDSTDGNWEVIVGRFDRDGQRHWEYPPYHDTPGDEIDQTRGLVAYDGWGPSPPGVVVVWLDHDEWDLYAQKVEVSAPANDECADAEPVGPGDYEFSLVGSTGDLTVSCMGTGSDVWLSFVAPSDGTLAVSTCGTNDLPDEDEGTDTVLSLHSSCPDGGGTYELECNDDWPTSDNPTACAAEDSGYQLDSWVESFVASGQEIKIRVSRYHLAVNRPFLLHVIFEAASPPNDACADAIPIGPGRYWGTTIAASTDGTTSCAGSESDVWYRYTAPIWAPHLFSTCGTHDLPGLDAGPDTVLSIHSACPESTDIHEITCNDDASGACGDADQGAPRDSRFVYLPAVGETVWIRVARFSFTPDGEFFLHVAPFSGRVPRDDWLDGPPLFVSKLNTGELWLTWGGSCDPYDNDYAVYMGPLGGWGLHEPIACSTGGATDFFHVPPGESVYYLAVPHNGVSDGSHGTQRYGLTIVERPPSPATCHPQVVGPCP